MLLKAENFQRGGAFKFRGAYNKLASLGAAERERGIITASSGNHAAAVALAANLFEARCLILMPDDASAFKVEAVSALGAEISRFDRYSTDREALLADLAASSGRTVVHPFDDELVMAGQGTVALELLEDAGEVDLLLCPVGGGGLIAGCATAIGTSSPTRVVGVEPSAGDDTRRSLALGERVSIPVPRTIADGQQLPTPGRLPFEVIKSRVGEIFTVSDDEIVVAMRYLFEHLQIVAEPSGASALAALLAGRVSTGGGRVGVVISGGNVGAERFCELIGTSS